MILGEKGVFEVVLVYANWASAQSVHTPLSERRPLMALHGTDLVTDRFFGVEERLGNTTGLNELGIHD